MSASWIWVGKVLSGGISVPTWASSRRRNLAFVLRSNFARRGFFLSCLLLKCPRGADTKELVATTQHPGEKIKISGVFHLEGLGSMEIQAFKYSGKGFYCTEIKRLELNASQGS